jgi:5-oxoprolinase (ATP-hydrolysing) subunit A
VNSTSEVRKEIKKVTSIDFNCDLAQGFGVYQNKDEFEFLDYVSSVNISAGFHAGDPVTIKNALLSAKGKNVVIGANIGFNDIQGFGMRAVKLSEDETEALVIYQVGALMSFAKAFGLEVEYVRPHGAMYQLASENFTSACAIAKAIKKCSKWLTYVGASGDVTMKTGDFIKLPIAQEINFNKVYKPDGTIDYNENEITDSDLLTRRLQRYMHYSQIDNTADGTSFVAADTIHFSNLELIKKANELITPKPVNYSKVEDSGWV